MTLKTSYRASEKELQLASAMMNSVRGQDNFSDKFPTSFIERTECALKSSQWDLLAEDFTHLRFIGQNGEFILIAPYLVRRQGQESTALTGIYGSVQTPVELPQVEKWLSQNIATLREPISHILPIQIHSAFGFAAQEFGEAFLVPDGWCFSQSELGPALNDIDEQRRRQKKAGYACLRNVFEPDSAELLIQSIKSPSIGTLTQNREYQYHEAGHVAGLGLKRKIQKNLLITPWYRAVEEWRADGVEFALAKEILSPEEAGRLVAANLALRFGIDAQRAGGMDRDTDVNAALLTFDRLLESGTLQLNSKKKLRFRDLSYSSLLKATELHAGEAVQLSQEEALLKHEQGIWNLYGSVKLSKASKVLFEGIVIQPCRGKFKELQ